MFTKKQIEKYKRTKYTRELERYLNRIVKFVTTKGFLHEEFEKYVDEIFKVFEDVEKVLLESQYYRKLEEFVEYSANLPAQKLQPDEITKIIQHKANQLQKIKRVRSFSKGKKHKGKYE